MHAFVRQGNGKYYISRVFGFYRRSTSEKEDTTGGKTYWIVWDQEQKRLIRMEPVVTNIKSLVTQVLIIDSDHSDWNVDDDGIGCVAFLNYELLDAFLDAKVQPTEILEKCRSLDDGYVYDEIQEIKTDADIENLSWASGGFHDGRIAVEELQDDGTLYLRFKGTWGCEIEVWLWGDLEYDTSGRDPETCDPYWFGSTIILQDGFVYFVDDDYMTVDKIGPGYCYFKARHMKYRIIPL